MSDVTVEDFLVWSKQQNIDMNGVTPARLHGRGLGIVAQRPLKVSHLRRRQNFLRYLLGWRRHSQCPDKGVTHIELHPAVVQRLQLEIVYSWITS